MTDIFSAGGQVAGAAISANSMKKATSMQIEALEKQARKVYAELDPSVLAGQTLDQDIANAKSRLGLQAITDPALAQSRFVGQNQMLDQLLNLGQSGSDEVAQLALESARGASPQLTKLKNQLIDTALSELQAGSSLPPGVQAELVKAGLEQGALVSGSTDPRGIAGPAARKLIGERALQLQNERQMKAAGLATTAAELERARTGLLANLFPTLQGQDLNKLSANQSAVSLSNALVPQAGLTGGDILNITSARVGAGNQLAQQQADASAALASGLGNIWGKAVGGATAALTSPDSRVGQGLNSLYGLIGL